MIWEVSYSQFTHPGRMLKAPKCRERNRTQAPSSHTACIGFSVLGLEQTKILKNLILKASGGRTSGTVLYGGAHWNPGRLNQGRVIKSFSPMKLFQVTVTFGCTLLQWVKKMLQMSTAVFDSCCVYTGSCIVGSDAMQPGKQSTFLVLRT